MSHVLPRDVAPHGGTFFDLTKVDGCVGAISGRAHAEQMEADMYA